MKALHNQCDMGNAVDFSSMSVYNQQTYAVISDQEYMVEVTSNEYLKETWISSTMSVNKQ